MPPAGRKTRSAPLSRVLEVLLAFVRLGLTSFGGPVAHLGYFREEFVSRRKWLDEAAYADVVALCQFLPGPASSQVGIALGLRRAGLPGGLAAWLGFTTPSAAALILFAYGVTALGGEAGAGWLGGLKVAAVAVVALAVRGMAGVLCPDRPRVALAVAAAACMLVWPAAWGQAAVMVVAGITGWLFLRTGRDGATPMRQFPVSRRLAVFCLALFGMLLVALPLLGRTLSHDTVGPLRVFNAFFRAGSLVFGGGHVVLPLLREQVVPPGWVSAEAFVAGYGAAQAVPGPLFTFSAYLGTLLDGAPTGWAGGLFALAAIFLPSFLLVIGVLPFWEGLRTRSGFGGALRGINAAVVGLLLAALYDPVWTSSIHGPEDFALALVAFVLLAVWRWPPWLVVLLSALGGQSLAFIPFSGSG